MNYVRSLFIIAILVNIGITCNGQEYQAYTQEQPVMIEDQSKGVEPTTAIVSSDQEETTPNKKEEKETIIEKPALQILTDHLDTLKIKGEQWDASNNVPDNSWTNQAITYAKNALDKDRTAAETIKSAFFDAISNKIEIEEGKFSEKTFAVITEFNEAIDAYLKTIGETETALQVAKTIILEETKPEPTVEVAPTPTETAPEPAAKEESTIQATSTSTSDDNAKNLLNQWYDSLYKVETEGTTLRDTQNLLSNVYDLAKKLLAEGVRAPEQLQSDLEYTLYDRNEFSNMQLFAINIDDAMEGFSQATGIPIHKQPLQKQQQLAHQERVAAEQKIKEQAQQEVAKQMVTQKALDLARDRAIEQAQESTIQKLQLQYQQKLALFQAEARAETDAKLAKLRKELTAPKEVTKAPEGIIGTAMGAFRGAASAASRWWYGITATEGSGKSLVEDQERLTKLRALLDALALTNQEKATIEKNWIIFISNLRSAPQLSDKTNQAHNNEWINKTGDALETLLMTYHIISIEDARDIIESVIEPSSNRDHIVKTLKKYLEVKRQKIIEAKNQKKADIAAKNQQREERKKIALLEQQKIKIEADRRMAEEKKKLLTINSYKDEKKQWNQLLAQLSHNTHPTPQDNNAQMSEAIKKSQSLLSLANQIPSKNKTTLSQKLKQKFTVALLEQQKINGNKINIHQNMDQFNKEINKMVE